jgi:CBS domain-containing protein
MTRNVKDVMTKTVVTVREDAPFKEIVELMEEYRVSALPVLDHDCHLVGVVSEGDLLLKEELAGSARGAPFIETRRKRHDRAKAEGLVAADLMTSPAITVEPVATLAQAARLMHHKRAKRLPVVDDEGRVVGIVSRADLLKVFLRLDDEIRRDVVDGLIRRTLLIDHDRIRVEVDEGMVTLEGRLDRASVVPVLVNLVRGIDGVVGVTDLLSWEVDDVARNPDVVTPWGVYAPSLRP